MRHQGLSNEFEVFVEFTHAVRRREELFDQFVTLMQSFGYDQVNFSITHDPDLEGRNIGFGLISTYPSDWQVYYQERGFARLDPVLHAARGGSPAFRWRDLERRYTLSARQVRFLRAAEAAGLYHGAGFPLAGPMQGGGVALACSTRQSAPLRNFDLINAFCQQLSAAYKRLCVRQSVEKSSLGILSDREAEILAWIAKGHSDTVIASRLDLSVNTIDYHVRNIFRKLEVNNRVAAVVTALTSGLLIL